MLFKKMFEYANIKNKHVRIIKETSGLKFLIRL